MTLSEKSMTVKQAAEYIQVNPWTLRRYIREGLIKSHKVGPTNPKAKLDARHVRIWRKDLDEFINADEVE